MQALLNIKEYFVDEISVKTNPDYTQAYVQNGEIDVDFDIRRSDSNKLEFMIPMTILLNSSETSFSAAEYQIRLRLTGFFDFLPGTDEETINRMIGPSGLSILYGIARGVVAQTTATCWHGKFILPSLNFLELLKEKAAREMKKASVAKKVRGKGASQ